MDSADSTLPGDARITDLVDSGVTNDRFGVRMLYPTKGSGEEWFLDPQDPGRRSNPPDTTLNPDGSLRVKSLQVRWGVYPSTGYDANEIATTNQPMMASKGYMQTANDWKNVEMTAYFKVVDYSDGGNGGPHIELMARGGRHTSGATCEGTAYHSNTYPTGRVKLEKELEHTAGYTDNDPANSSAGADLQDRWVGLKAIFYNRADGSVRLEQWIDDETDNVSAPGNRWRKALEHDDTGSWGGGTPSCGGTGSTIITWGGPIATFRWDNIGDMQLKFLSVREIEPPI
jgi:hypothetical protein